MKLRDLPAIPTIFVTAAVGVMIALGVWQLDRAEWKEGLLERYAAAGTQTAVRFPSPEEAVNVLYRPSSIDCERVIGMRATGARDARGRQGWAHVANCAIGGGREAEVAIGWTLGPEEISWDGGEVTGILAPAGDLGARLMVGDPPLGRLEPLPPPDPADLPNNHLAYAGQWFFFALTALVIFVLAVRRRGGSQGRS